MTSALTCKQKYYQIILNNVPCKNGSTKTLSYRKPSSESYITYQELFEFLEEHTGIPKKYFILKYNKREITYIEAFIKYYASHAYDNYAYVIAENDFAYMSVKIHYNIDYAIYKFYKNLLTIHKCPILYLDILRFADELFASYTPGTTYEGNYRSNIVDDPCYMCYSLLQSHIDLFETLSTFKRFRILTSMETISRSYKTEHLEGLAKL